MTRKCDEVAYLALVPRGTARGQHAVFDTTSSKVIDHSMIRHREHTGIVFVRRVRVQNTLTQEQGQTRRLRQVLFNALGALEAVILRITGIEAEEEGWDLVGVRGTWESLPRWRSCRGWWSLRRRT